MYLQELSGHENIVRLLSVIKADNDRDIYLTFDYMGEYSLGAGVALNISAHFPLNYAETDLHAVIRANILVDIHKQYIIYQLLKALKFMHSAELLHRGPCYPCAPSPSRLSHSRSIPRQTSNLATCC